MECSVEEWVMLWDRLNAAVEAGEHYAIQYMIRMNDFCLAALGVDGESIHTAASEAAAKWRAKGVQ